MRKPVLPALLALLLVGCLDFEKQTLTYHHDARSDTLLIHLRYEGVFGADGEPGLSDREREQLASVMKSGRAFFFANWILEFDRGALQESLGKSLDASASAVERQAHETSRQLIRQLIACVHIENGPFFTGAGDRLSAVQRITVTNVSGLLTSADAAIRAALKADAAKPDSEEASKKGYLKSAADPAPFIRVRGNEIQVRFPLSRKDFEDQDEGATRMLAEFKRQGGRVAFADDEVTGAFGTTNSVRESLTLPVAEKAYLANAVSLIRDLHGLAPAFNPVADTDRFLSRLRK